VQQPDAMPSNVLPSAPIVLYIINFILSFSESLSTSQRYISPSFSLSVSPVLHVATAMFCRSRPRYCAVCVIIS